MRSFNKERCEWCQVGALKTLKVVKATNYEEDTGLQCQGVLGKKHHRSQVNPVALYNSLPNV